MKKSRFSDHQIMEALKRVEAGLPVPELCREDGISTATFFKWRAKSGGMDTSMMARMKELEEENRRLKKMCIDPVISCSGVNFERKHL
jgi:putative transposase